LKIQLKEKENENQNKWNEQDKEKLITSLKMELEEAKNKEHVLKNQMK